LTIERLSTQQLHDVYLDTPDWRIFRAGFALRLRDRKGKAEATLKELQSARKDVADRRELTEPLPDGGMKALVRATGSVGSRVRDVAGVEPLRTLFEVRTSRQRFAVRRLDPCQELGEIALDETRFLGSNGPRRSRRLRRVELESIGPDHGSLELLADRLRTECALETARENKFAAGLHSAALQPPLNRDADQKDAAAPSRLHASVRAGEFAAAALSRLLMEWHDYEPGARLGERPEALHALRVTARRIDTVLSLFGAYLPATLRKSRQKVKRLVDALGAVRDVDVRLQMVSTYRDALPEAHRNSLDPVLRQLKSERLAAHSRMLRVLDAKPARRWLDTLSGQLDTGRGWLDAPSRQLSRAAGLPRTDTALLVVPELIRKRYRKLRKCAQQLDRGSSLSDYHELRIHAKKLRYALELVTPTYAKPADEMLSALHKLQSRLGSQHDGDVISRYLGQAAAAPGPDFSAQTLFLIGRLAELHSRDAAGMSGKIRKSWRKVCGRRWKALRARMKQSRGDSATTHDGGNDIAHSAARDDEPASASAASASSETRGP
jgi:CHAD domain-containing protein